MANSSHGPDLQCSADVSGRDDFRRRNVSTQKQNYDRLARLHPTSAQAKSPGIVVEWQRE